MRLNGISILARRIPLSAPQELVAYTLLFQQLLNNVAIEVVTWCYL